MKRWIVAASLSLSLCAIAPAQEFTYQDIALPELLYRLPLSLKKQVATEGRLVAWGDLAALDSEASREVMIDLQQLPDDVRGALNAECAHPNSCAARVLGTVRHLKGESYSELGVEADEIVYVPAPVPEGPAISCTLDDNMASTRCDTGPNAISISSITINGGKCPVWNHRLIKDELDSALRSSGDVTSTGEYTTEEVKKLSAAVLSRITSAPIAAYDFFRFEAYRCSMRRIDLETSAGPIQLLAHH